MFPRISLSPEVEITPNVLHESCDICLLRTMGYVSARNDGICVCSDQLKAYGGF